jgi:hypothetical protein
MGIPTIASDFQAANKRFSSDVLKIEIAGPQQHHLSVVDVPGKPPDQLHAVDVG